MRGLAQAHHPVASGPRVFADPCREGEEKRDLTGDPIPEDQIEQLIPLTVPESGRFGAVALEKAPASAAVIRWSLRRRHHQHQAREHHHRRYSGRDLFDRS